MAADKIRKMLLGIGMSCGVAFAQAPPDRLPERVSVTEYTLRKYVVKYELPIFPAKSLRMKRQGVAVSQIRVDNQGIVTDVMVLEAPDKQIAKAVGQALQRWRFKPPTIHGKSVPITGKLTFYFVIDDGSGSVRNPKSFQ